MMGEQQHCQFGFLVRVLADIGRGGIAPPRAIVPAGRIDRDTCSRFVAVCKLIGNAGEIDDSSGFNRVIWVFIGCLEQMRHEQSGEKIMPYEIGLEAQIDSIRGFTRKINACVVYQNVQWVRRSVFRSEGIGKAFHALQQRKI